MGGARRRSRWLTVSALACGTLLVAGCLSRAFMRESTQEYRNQAIDARTIQRLVIVPAAPNQHDARVASRSHEILELENWPAVLRRVVTADHAAATRNVCEARDINGEVDAVAYVTWDRISVRTCASPSEVAYEVQGAYAGVDTLTRRMLSYLRAAPPEN